MNGEATPLNADSLFERFKRELEKLVQPKVRYVYTAQTHICAEFNVTGLQFKVIPISGAEGFLVVQELNALLDMARMLPKAEQERLYLLLLELRLEMQSQLQSA